MGLRCFVGWAVSPKQAETCPADVSMYLPFIFFRYSLDSLDTVSVPYPCPRRLGHVAFLPCPCNRAHRHKVEWRTGETARTLMLLN